MRKRCADYHWVLPRAPASIPLIRERALTTAAQSCAGFSAQSLHEWSAVIVEAVGNIIRHNVDSSPTASIAIALQYRPHCARFTSVDAGKRYRVPPRRAPVAHESESGRGFAMLYAWCTHIRLRRVANHNILRLTYVDRHGA